MTKIFALAKEGNLSPSQDKLLEFLKRHPFEVFAIKEQEKIAEALEMNRNNVGWCLWALEKKDLIRKRRIGRKVYYGSHEAIANLDKELAKK
jgi:hypothetical protein